MKVLLPLAGALLALPSLSSAQQCSFEVITFDRIRLDPNFALLTSTRWGILVNTGSVPISLGDDWETGLWYAESSQPLGSFFHEQLNPFGAGLILQPGEAVGDDHPLLLAELLPGETFVTPALIRVFQFGVPFPSSDFHVDFYAQMGDQIAKSRTDIEIADLGGAAFWEPVSAKRVSCSTSPATYASYGNGCAHPLGTAQLRPLGFNGGGGLPHIAYLSNMPQVGNWAFGVEIESPVHNPSYVVGIDFAPGSFSFSGCELLLGLTPGLTTFSGTVPHFLETQSVPIPDQPTLVGVKAYAQGVLLAPLFLTTNGLEFTLGDVTV